MVNDVVVDLYEDQTPTFWYMRENLARRLQGT